MSRKLTVFMLLALMGACKPGDNASITLESGGTTADLRVKSTVNSKGELRLEKSGNSAGDDNYTISAASLQLSSGPDGQIFNSALVDHKYMALRASDDDLKFDILMTTKGAGTCYVNAALLNGTSDPVSCKPADPSAATGSEALRQQMESACDRLSRIRLDDGFFSKYDASTNHDSCTCLNGVTREVLYSDFFAKTVLDFENECRRKATDTVSLAAAVKIGNAACIDLQNAATGGKITAYPDYCACGAKQLRYDDDAYRNQADKLRTDCQAAAAGN